MEIHRPPKAISTSYASTLPHECASLLEDRGPLRIIDVGCGRAVHRASLTQRGHRYLGIDLRSIRADVRADMNHLPFGNGHFDAALLFSSLQYSVHPHLALQEMSRVLCPGGTLTGCVAFLEPAVWEGLMHLSARGIRVLVEEAGFKLKYIWPSWDVFEALASALRQEAGDSSECKTALRKIDAASQATFSNLPESLDFCGSIYFHAVKI